MNAKETTAAMNQHYTKKERRRVVKEERWNTMDSMLKQVANDQQEIKEASRAAQVLCEDRHDEFIAELRKQNAERQALLRSVSDGLRADFRRQHEATMEAIRASSHEPISFDSQRYLDEFTKSIGKEVRSFVNDVSKLREERRVMQYELGFLLTTKSKYGPTGEFEPEWRPPNFSVAHTSAPPPPPPPARPPAGPQLFGPTPSGWRSRKTRAGRKPTRQREGTTTPAPIASSSRHVWHPDRDDTSPGDSSIFEQMVPAPYEGAPEWFGSSSSSDIQDRDAWWR